MYSHFLIRSNEMESSLYSSEISFKSFTKDFYPKKKIMAKVFTKVWAVQKGPWNTINYKNNNITTGPHLQPYGLIHYLVLPCPDSPIQRGRQAAKAPTEKSEVGHSGSIVIVLDEHFKCIRDPYTDLYTWWSHMYGGWREPSWSAK